ncbi:hypothetical protein ACFHWD_01640 [Clostridium sp. MT-14]|jgi:hypothetical protein|uniref:Uncharacterized protein n=1 Tax=Clostridium aromativorans TaxID=2836848 RepID=A0ABS8NCB0_9CLOT|nr:MULTISPECIES: hypothetical protein [Clostridium]KAA8674534.1 hypothetical protein F3O63_07270 [Clostridium sp. HV4-5-A1G]MCC9296358.1 hypothetical protein [Clostridium aromativorans]CAB1253438.1 conserved hypothetical protein [Clostridiaceae bacterium BL-3]
MKDKKDLKSKKNVHEGEVHEDAIDKNAVFAGEDDEVVLNCDGEPCNFSYRKDLSDDSKDSQK